MWLLDANMDVHLVDILEGFGVVAETARARGWAALANGDLVQQAGGEGFTCLLTHDRAFGQSAAKALRDQTTFSVVLVTLQQQPSKQYCESFTAAWEQQPIRPSPGAVISWP